MKRIGFVLLAVVFGFALGCGIEQLKEEERRADASASARTAQKKTVADMRNVGTAMFSWLTDQIGAAAAGQSQVPQAVEMGDYVAISHADLATILVPSYLQEVPALDGWDVPYEYYLNPDNPRAQKVLSIRSPGRDKAFSGTSYTVTSFDPSRFDEDIVWADGYFIRWPQRKPEQ